MKKTIVISLFLLFIVVGVALTDSPAVRLNTTYKDPFLAGVLSWVMPGAGQIYCQSYTKGSVFIFGDMIEKSSMVFILLYLNNKYFKTSSDLISWERLDVNDKTIIISYFVLSASFKLFNAMDAVFTAEKFNTLHMNDNIGFHFDLKSLGGGSHFLTASLTWSEGL